MAVRWVAGPVAELVEAGAVPVDRREERRPWWHLHEIQGRHIEGAVAANADVGAGRLDQGVGLGHDGVVRHHRHGAADPIGQAVALGGVEDDKALEEGHACGLVVLPVCALSLGSRHEAVGIDDRGAALALADMTAQIQRLPVGQPVLAGEAASHGGIPQDEDVDAGIAASRDGVAGQAERAGALAPGPDPGYPALLQFTHDAAGDFGIEGRPVGFRAAFDSRHRASPLALPTRPSPDSGVGGEERPGGPPTRAGRTCRGPIAPARWGGHGRNAVEDPKRSGGLRPARAGLQGRDGHPAAGDASTGSNPATLVTDWTDQMSDTSDRSPGGRSGTMAMEGWPWRGRNPTP